jgi:hypothetical protein
MGCGGHRIEIPCSGQGDSGKSVGGDGYIVEKYKDKVQVQKIKFKVKVKFKR